MAKSRSKHDKVKHKGYKFIIWATHDPKIKKTTFRLEVMRGGRVVDHFDAVDRPSTCYDSIDVLKDSIDNGTYTK